MTRKIETKLLAILAVTALALMPAFALISSDGSSASGTHDVNVNDWGQFKTAMKDAREAPEDTFNITLTSPIYPEEGITIPSNVNMTVKGGTGISIINEVATGKIYDRKAVVNEGNITLKTGSRTEEAGTIYALGKNASFVNRGTVVMEDLTRLMANEHASIVNYGTITADSVLFIIQNAGLTNEGTISLTRNGHLNIENGSKMTNSGTIEGDGYLLISKSEANNLAKITCNVRGDMTQETSIVYDSNKAGKTIWSEGFETRADRDKIDYVLMAYGNKTVLSIIEDAIDSSSFAPGDVIYADADLQLISYFCDAEYPHNMTLRSAMFDLTITLKSKIGINAMLPAEGTYSYDQNPPMESRAIYTESTVKISGLLRMDAYFDEGEMLDRLDITLGLGVRTVATTDLQVKVDPDEYTFTYRPTKYDFGMSLDFYISIDFDNFDLMSYNPGDEWDLQGTIKIAKIGGDLILTSNFYAANLLKYLTLSDTSESLQEILDDLKYRGRTALDLDELFNEIIRFLPTVGSVSGTSAATPAVNGLFDLTFLFSAKASMGDDGNITLTRGNQSTGTIDVGELFFDALESEGETSISMSSEINGDSMMSFVSGAASVFIGDASQEQIEGILNGIGAEYSESTVSVKQMDRMCDQKKASINKMSGADDRDNTGTYIVLALVAAMAAVILVSMFIKRE